jgi:hypothetical protein
MPDSEVTVASVSTQVPRRTAARMPSGSASTKANAMPTRASRTVYGSTVKMRSATVGRWRGLGHWWPRLPSTTWPRKVTNWVGID